VTVAESTYWLGVAVNCIISGWSVYRCWRDHRQIEAYKEILDDLCIKSFHNQSMPIWKAWANVMGTITVSIKRKEADQ
jgi:hypothetical protein